MGLGVTILASLTALLCAVLLLRAYARTRMRLLLWSGLCFAGTALSNSLIILDLAAFPDTNLYTLRLSITAAALLLLQYGLVFESDRP
jgi:hypothetical protein